MLIKSNVLNKDITNKIISDTLIDISDIVSNSLGPYGANSILEDRIQNHIITKDGYTILNKLMYDNEVSQTVLEIVKRISRSLVKEVGDGSTSSIIIASELYNSFSEMNKEKNIPPKIILDILKEYEKILEEKIMEQSIEITDENFDKLTDIATISNNNDIKLGKLISDLYRTIGKDGFITLENSKTEEDHYEITDGYEMDYGYTDKIFANNVNQNIFEADNPFIFISNDSLTEEDLPKIKEVIEKIMKLRRSLVIIAKSYDAEVHNFLRINKLNNKQMLNVVSIDYSLANENRKETLKDFAILTGATIYDKANFNEKENIELSDLGMCNKVIIDERRSKFIDCKEKESKSYYERLKYLEEQLEEIKSKDTMGEYSSEIFNLQKRISMLSSKVATFYVGGNSELEKENRKFLLEDSTYACQSALRNGYIIGGNLVIPTILNNSILKDDLKSDFIVPIKNINETFDEEIISLIGEKILSSFLSGFKKVLDNRFKNDTETINTVINECIEKNKIFNLKLSEYETVEKTSIINSSKTDIEIMKSAFSIIGLLVTSNQFVSRSIIRDEFYK